jgi:hypothetical protein
MIPIHIYPAKDKPGQLEFASHRGSALLNRFTPAMRRMYNTPKADEHTTLLEQKLVQQYSAAPYTEATQQALRKLYDRT